MTYGEMKNMVLQLLNRYTIAGEPVALTYNDQADLTARIPALTRDALYYITTTARRMRTVVELAEPEMMGGFPVFDLPDDCYQMIGGLLQVEKDGSVSRKAVGILLVVSVGVLICKRLCDVYKLLKGLGH